MYPLQIKEFIPHGYMDTYFILKDNKGYFIGQCCIDFNWCSKEFNVSELRNLRIEKAFRERGFGRYLITKIKEKYSFFLFCAPYNNSFYRKCGLIYYDHTLPNTKKYPYEVFLSGV